MEPVRVAIVTGANRGIGYHIVAKLASALSSNFQIYLTARNASTGAAAVKELAQSNVAFHELDISKTESVAKFAAFLRATHGDKCIDILVNNAAAKMTPSAGYSAVDAARDTFQLNYTATRDLFDAYRPLLRPHARVVNVSSTMGLRSHLASATLRERFSDPLITVSQLDTLASEYLAAVEANKIDSDGWRVSPYGFSKVLLNALTVIQAREMNDPTILVNSCHPGWCQTSMGGPSAPMTAASGAETPVFLALLPNGAQTSGKYFDNKIEQRM